MRYSILKRTKQKLSKKPVYGFDIETYGRDNRFYCATVYLDENNHWTFYDKEELIRFFKQRRFCGAIVAATNLAFDFFGVFNDTEEVKEFDFLFRGSDLVYSKVKITKDGKFSKHCPRERHRGTLTFIDTYNYCKMSVEKMGGVLGVEKLELPPGIIGRKPCYETELIVEEYNIRDAEISKRYLDFLYKSFEVLGATPKLTIASTAMSLFKNKYLDDEYFRHNQEDLLDIFEGYYGGRVEVFRRGKVEDLSYYDFNSLYPSCMLEMMPDPNTHRVTYKDTADYIMQYEGMSDVLVECPEMRTPLLPYRTEDKLVFPTGRFRSWYTHLELRKALSLGYKILKVFKTHYYKGTCRPFKGYVEDLYAKRLDYQHQCTSCGRKDVMTPICPCGEPVGSPMEMVVKLLLNGLYGKFGQKFLDKDNWLPFNLTREELDKLTYFERHGDFIRIKKDLEPAAFCIPIWASYVTAHARIKLHNTLVDCDPVYCDTDSIVTRKELPTGQELGMLKKEYHIDKGLFIKAKMYACLDTDGKEHIKLKGLAKEIIREGVKRKLDLDEFVHILDNPHVFYDKFLKFKEGQRRKIAVNTILECSKELNMEDDKRIWPAPFDKRALQNSSPLNIVDDFQHQPESATSVLSTLSVDTT